MQSGTHHARLVSLLTVAGLLACTGQEQGEQTAMSQMEGGEQMEAAQQMAADTLRLSPKNDSGISGSAVLEAHGDSATVVLTIDGGTPGSTYASHIHTGDCDAPGGVEAPLSSVTVGDDGSGTATTTVAAGVIEGADLLIQVHLPGGTPAACGEIAE